VVERLPEFDLVAVGVVDPGEAAVAVVFALAVDGDAGVAEFGEVGVEVVDDVVPSKNSILLKRLR
jgi:hypothetical protein